MATWLLELLVSCGPLNICLSLEEIRKINLFNFSPNEADSVVILRYKTSMAGAKPLDTFITKSIHGNNPTEDVIIMDHKLNPTYKYVIRFPRLNADYSISEFTFETRYCSSQDWIHPKFEYVQLLSYKVNDKIQKTDSKIFIYK